MNSKKRKIESKEELAVAVAEIARLSVEANILRATLDERILDIKDDMIPRIEEAQKALKAHVAAAKVWAIANKDEFGPGKSIRLGLGTVGFRTGMPKLAFLKGWTVEKVIAAVLSRFPRRGYVRTVEELDKAALIADRDKLTACDCDNIGVEIGQEETFFVDVDMDAASRTTEAR
jgi:phage host-nuclease inhibitor protein Gam